MKKYTVKIRGIVHTMQLSDEDAKRLGATEVKPVAPGPAKATKRARPANKSAQPANK